MRSFRWSPETVFSREPVSRAALRASEGLAGAPLARWKGIFRTDEGVLLLEVAGGQMHEERSPLRFSPSPREGRVIERIHDPNKVTTGLSGNPGYSMPFPNQGDRIDSQSQEALSTINVLLTTITPNHTARLELDL